MIDWDQIEILFGEPGEAIDAEMVELFHQFTRESGARLDTLKAGSVPPVETLAREAHRIRGAAANFGFSTVAELLLELEHGAPGFTGDQTLALLAKIHDSFLASIREVEARYPAAAPTHAA
ncbi:MAG: Hpt domain-containing protein [Puniceicoccaceae bacterium]|nr:MAG: Hpt domain-containing protein [Puniceicoccaceae bacterium]